jgi:AraC family transcriptional regulator
VIDWDKEAERFTFCLDPGFLMVTVHDVIIGATGALVWAHEEGYRVCITPTVHPVLLVHATSARLHEDHVEIIPHLLTGDPLQHHMALVLQAAHDADSAADQLYAEVMANALALHFLRRYAACQHPVREVTGGLSPAKLRRTIAYIQAHLEHPLSLAVLADTAQLSPNHFAHLFKLATGQTPHQYVLGCRIARAKQLLAETDMPLSAIGPQVGLTDQSYFTALFRKHVTMTPKAYRDAMHRA